MSDAKKVPLGDGLADQAKRDLLGRRQRIEDALAEIEGRDNDVRREDLEKPEKRKQ